MINKIIKFPKKQNSTNSFKPLLQTQINNQIFSSVSYNLYKTNSFLFNKKNQYFSTIKKNNFNTNILFYSSTENNNSNNAPILHKKSSLETINKNEKKLKCEIKQISSKIKNSNLNLKKIKNELSQLKSNKKIIKEKVENSLSTKESLEEIYKSIINNIINKDKTDNINIENNFIEISKKEITKEINIINITNKLLKDIKLNFTDDSQNNISKKIYRAYKDFFDGNINNFLLRISLEISNLSLGKIPESIINILLRCLLKINIIDNETSNWMIYLQETYKKKKNDLKSKLILFEKKRLSLEDKKMYLNDIYFKLYKKNSRKASPFVETTINLNNSKKKPKHFLSRINKNNSLNHKNIKNICFNNENNISDSSGINSNMRNKIINIKKKYNININLINVKPSINKSAILKDEIYFNTDYTNQEIGGKLNKYCKSNNDTLNKISNKSLCTDKKNLKLSNNNYIQIKNNIIRNNLINNNISNCNNFRSHENKVDKNNSENKVVKIIKTNKNYRRLIFNCLKNKDNSKYLSTSQQLANHSNSSSKNKLSKYKSINNNYLNTSIKNSNKNLALSNFIKINPNFNKNKKILIYYYKFIKNNIKFNTIKENKNPEEFGYNKGNIIIDITGSLIKIIPKISNAKSNIIIINIKNILLLDVDKEMKNVIKLRDILMKNNEKINLKAISIKKLMNIKEIKIITDIEQNEKIHALLQNYFTFSLEYNNKNRNENTINIIEFIFIDYKQYRKCINFFEDNLAKRNRNNFLSNFLKCSSNFENKVNNRINNK